MALRRHPWTSFSIQARTISRDTISANATLTTHTVLAGFAYKFGGPFVVQ